MPAISAKESCAKRQEEGCRRFWDEDAFAEPEIAAKLRHPEATSGIAVLCSINSMGRQTEPRVHRQFPELKLLVLERGMLWLRRSVIAAVEPRIAEMEPVLRLT